MSIRWLEADWPAPQGVRVISTYRMGGMSEGRYASLNLGDHVADAATAVMENRRLLQGAASLPAEPCWLSQVHGTDVADLDSSLPRAADAAISRSKGVVCAVLTADCLPVVFTNETAEVVGAAHAGWRGLAAGVLEATVNALGVPPRQLMAWLAPCIGPKHFEVGEEVREAFLNRDAGADVAFRPNVRGRFMADLAELARRRLRSAGLTRIYGGGHCTFEDSERFFSHRRDGTTGRQVTLIWRESG
jgi:YfiH family protein